MGKKSAKSKGYRKAEQKKPFLTKKEIILLVAIVAAIVLVVVLFNIFYDDGYLGVDEVRSTDLVSFVSRDITSRYVKLGEVHELPGFTLDEAESETNARVAHIYLPEDGSDGALRSLNIAGNFNTASGLANDQTTIFELDSYDFSEVQTTSLNGRDAYIYSLNYDYDPAEAQDDTGTTEAPETMDAETTQSARTYEQSINCYVDMGDYSICIYISRSGGDESVYIPDEDLADYVAGFSDAFTPGEPIKK